MIELDGVERSFHYWRDTSAARHLADDPAVLERALAGASLIHLSGITLAILSPTARETLFAALGKARAAGARIAFDPNIRARLWSSPTVLRDTLTAVLRHVDIALPSFDDESAHFGDASPQATLARFHAAGVAEAGAGAWRTLTLPEVPAMFAPILYAVPAQLLAYHTAIAKGTDVDQPRNLAKSVTVE